MFLACEGLGPQLTPRLARGDQCRIEFHAARLFSNANTGQPKACRCFILLPTLMELKCSSLEVPLSKIGKVVWRKTAFPRAYGQRAKWMVAGHHFCAWRSCFLALSRRSRMAVFAMLFLKWPLTLQKVRCYPLVLQLFLKVLSVNCTLLQWQWRMRTPCCLAKHLNARLASIVSSEVNLVMRWMYLSLE